MIKVQYMMTEVQCIAKYNNNLQYSKDLIAKLLYNSTQKNIEILLSDATNGTALNCTNKLVELVNLHLNQQQETLSTNSQYYLVICINQNDIVHMSYLGYLYYNVRSSGWSIWEMAITPLVNFSDVVHNMQGLDAMLAKILVLVNPSASRWYNDCNIIETHVAKVIEHAALRITYSNLNTNNFEQYKKQLMDIYNHEVGFLAKTHAMILENLLVDDIHKLNTVNLENLEVHSDELSILGDTTI